MLGSSEVVLMNQGERLLGTSWAKNRTYLLGIYKVTQVHVLDVHGEGERLIGRESATVDGEGYLG